MTGTHIESKIMKHDEGGTVDSPHSESSFQMFVAYGGKRHGNKVTMGISTMKTEREGLQAYQHSVSYTRETCLHMRQKAVPLARFTSVSTVGQQRAVNAAS
jgi:hypothetical protein